MIATAAGKKVYPEEVEAALANPLIREVVVVGGRDRAGREEVQALIVPERAELERIAQDARVACDDAFVEARIRGEVARAAEALAPYKRPKRVIVRREDFPRTATGKIRRQGLAEPADDRDAVA
jgi:long-chain acyl-CoA synthetase